MRIVMMGTGAFAEPTFQALLDGRYEVAGLVTNPDRPSGRERETVRHIKEIAVSHGTPVFQPESVNTPEGIAGVRQFTPELLVVAAYGQILSKELLAIPHHGGINVHASLLPKYRGAAPIAWAIYHGETRTGVTIIRMSPRMDAGDMLAQEAIDILPDETAGDLEARLAPLGATLAMRVIEQIEAGTAHGVKQDLTQVTKAPKLKKEHGLIDWSRSAEQVCNHIRAMQPWPTAYTFLHQEGRPPLRLIVTKARSDPPMRVTESGIALGPVSQDNLPPYGRVVRADDRSIVVAARDGLVELLWLQPAGKRVMTAADFIHGHPVREGDQLGPEVISR